jgi:hypothetical protein
MTASGRANLLRLNCQDIVVAGVRQVPPWSESVLPLSFAPCRDLDIPARRLRMGNRAVRTRGGQTWGPDYRTILMLREPGLFAVMAFGAGGPRGWSDGVRRNERRPFG